MKLLVTGGCGFIGTNFIRYVHANRPDWQVFNIDKLTYAAGVENLTDLEGPRYRFEMGDVCNREFIEKVVVGQDAIVHFAAESHVDRSIIDPTPFLKTNVEGTGVLLQAAHRAKVPRFLHISTDEVYGDVKAPGKSKEADGFKPSSPYAASKAAADLFAQSFFRTYRFPVITARSSNNFGPYQFPEKVIPLWTSNLLAGQPVPMYGDGGQVRDWIYVEDNVRALVLLLEKGKPGEAYNVGAGNSITNKKLAETLQKALGSKAGTKKVADRPGHDRRYALDVSKMMKLGWKPKYDLRQGLDVTLKWYREHQAWWEKKRSVSAKTEALREQHASGKV